MPNGFSLAVLQVPEAYAKLEADGRVSTLEMLRRQTFEERSPDDLALARVLLRQALRVFFFAILG